MRIESVSRSVFDSVDQAVKSSFNGTISKKIPLKNIGDWYREIDISEDAQMLFLRTANQCMPLPFKNIATISKLMNKVKVGEDINVSSGNNWGLTGAAAAFGWLAISHTTKMTVVDKFDYVHYIRIGLIGHPTDSEAFFLCNNASEAEQIVNILEKIMDEHKNIAVYYDQISKSTRTVETKPQGTVVNSNKNDMAQQIALPLLILAAALMFLVIILNIFS